jgi:hypothetical protein
MRWLRNLFLFSCAIVPVGLLGHMDPVGDVHPHVSVKDGFFVVEFSNNRDRQPNQKNHFRVVYDSEGKVILPRHPVKEPRAAFFAAWYGQTRRTAGENQFRMDDEATKMEVLSGETVLSTLSIKWPGGANPLEIFEDFAVTEKSLLILGTLLEEDRGYRPPELVMARFSVRNEGPPMIEKIGKVATIYSFPTCSPLQVVGDNVLVAWMGEKTEPNEGHAFYLTRINLRTGEKRTQKLPADYYWNTQISIAAIGDRICIAWHHGQIYGMFQESKIRTLFLDMSEW